MDPWECGIRIVDCGTVAALFWNNRLILNLPILSFSPLRVNGLAEENQDICKVDL